MTVNDAMRELRKIEDAIDTLVRYGNGTMPSIAERYMDKITELKIAE